MRAGDQLQEVTLRIKATDMDSMKNIDVELGASSQRKNVV
jgi:hypothetical protein